MGNSASPGLGSSANRGLRDVRLTEPETEVERPPASPEPNRKSQESNRKSQEQLPVAPKPYTPSQPGVRFREGAVTPPQKMFGLSLLKWCVLTRSERVYH